MRDTNRKKFGAVLRMGVICAGTAMWALPPAMTDMVDRPHFRVDGVAIVWAADSSDNTPIASDFIVESGGTQARVAYPIAGSDYWCLRQPTQLDREGTFVGSWS